MGKNLFFTDFKDILYAKHRKELADYEVTCQDIDIACFKSEHFATLYLDAYVYLLLSEGEVSISVNYETQTLKSPGILVLTPLHIVQFIEVTPQIAGKLLVVNKPFLDIVPSMEKVFKHLNRSLKLYSNPAFGLLPADYVTLNNCMQSMQNRLKQTKHIFLKEILQNQFVTFLLEWINIYESYASLNPSEVNLNRSEQILQSFISLLKDHFKSEHLVSFYADKLHITPQYLTLIVKKLTGQTITDFVYEMLYSEARILLSQSDRTIQQIADELHFSDSSSFCKFFKRRSGTSPLKYRFN